MIFDLPVLVPSLDDHGIPTGSIQPILSFKELEVDRVRYDAYKAMLARAETRRLSAFAQTTPALKTSQ